MTRKIKFLLAGQRRASGRAFLTTRSRQAAQSNTVCHRNRYSTIIRIPVDVFHKRVAYEHWSGIYRTDLTYGGLADYTTVIDHESED